MKIAVVGAGIFGVTAATRLAKSGHSVDLFEKHGDILQAASGINQFRLHRGYHYPRSPETIRESLSAQESFAGEYRPAIIDDFDHHYCIAKEKSFVSGDQFMKTCLEYGLEHEHCELGLVSDTKVGAKLKVKESLVDLEKLKELCWKKLNASRVRVLLNTKADAQSIKKYDFIVLCMYADNNEFTESLGIPSQDYQYELCEKIVIKLPDQFKNKSIVIMDGPFMCVDPFGKTNLFLMGNVVHAIHHSNVGKHPEIPSEFIPLLNRGVIKNPPITNFSLFIDSAAEFIPAIKQAEHVGSMYTVRTVLANVDKTDKRPTLVDRVAPNIVRVFSGKIGTCVQAAQEVERIINEMEGVEKRVANERVALS
ncbi:FAD-binding oxidoreductase [Candidatus Parcubacteria bacterium]|nr:MAG: FAD-binding oxidoreductase [Candidatus Parcubacteria bacterium]